MAYNLSTLVTRVQKRVKDTSYSSTGIQEFINDTQNAVFNEFDLRFMQKSQNYTLTVNEKDIANGNGLPADFVRTINLRNSTKGYTLDYISFDRLDEKYPDHELTAAGTPRRWYLFADEINVHPKPIEADSVTLKYIKRPVELTSDDDVPEIPQEFAELLIYGACARVMETKDNFDLAAIYENKYLAELQKLVNRYAIPQTAQAQVMKLGGK